jgi:HK97 family phage prohead protease
MTISLRGFPTTAIRSFDLEDIAIRADGTGRTVEAYAAVFTPYPVRDYDGDYDELIMRSAFDRTLSGGFRNVRVLFNHGMTNALTPSDRYSMPIGTPVEVSPDSKGLFTVTRYNKTPLADEVLELIRDGAVRAQSFVGKWIRSVPRRAVMMGGRDVIERHEIALREYGPVTFEVAHGAEILAVRSVATLADEISMMSAEQRAELDALLRQGTPVTPADPGTDDGDPPDPDEDPESAAATTPVDDTALEYELRKRQLLT